MFLWNPAKNGSKPVTETVLNDFRKLKLPNKGLIETGKDMVKLQITDADIKERAFLGKKLNSSEIFQEKPKKEG